MRDHDPKIKEPTMKRSRLLSPGILVFVAVLVCAFLVVGCGENPSSVLGPGDTGGTGNILDHGKGGGGLQYVLDNYGDPFAPRDSSAQALAKTFKLKEDGDTATIGSAGGTLELQMRGFKSKLKVPKNALSGDVLMSVEGILFSTPPGDVLLYDFGPDGLVFNVPSELEVDAGQLKDNTCLSLFWWNPVTGEWEFQQEVVVKGHKIKFDVYHFSKYGITAR
jgi:hypothetical protein